MGKYTKETADQIIELIRKGNFEKYAFGACGISHQTYHRWKKEKSDFYEAVKSAKRERITSLVSRIAKAAEDPKTWAAAAWLLQRLDAKRFHQPTQAEKEMSVRLDTIEQKLNKFFDTSEAKEVKTNGNFATP